MTNALVLSTVENEARVRDVDLAVSLGMKQPLNIRAFIQRNRDELASFGPIHTQRELVTIGSGATREVLPSIRKTGGYQLGAGETMPLPTSFTDALRQHASGTRAPGERWPPNVSRKGRHGGSSRAAISSRPLRFFRQNQAIPVAGATHPLPPSLTLRHT